MTDLAERETREFKSIIKYAHIPHYSIDSCSY